MSEFTRESFNEALKDKSLDEIVAILHAETGQTLKAKTKPAAISEAFDVYVSHMKKADERLVPPPVVDAAPPAAKPAPVIDPAAFDNVKPAEPRKPAQAARRAQEAAKASPSVASEPLQYQGRSRTGKPFHVNADGRHMVFGPKWEPIGALTDAEIEKLKKRSAHVSFRVRG